MTDYRLFGADTSPYSQKVRSFLQYKDIAYEWVARSRENEDAFQAAARVPTVPLLISPRRPVSQDSTAMLATLEKDHAEPSSTPDDPACAALALLLEDYADEWLNKSMFQQRWSRPPDSKAAALRTFQHLYGGKPPRARKAACEQIAERMAERLSLVGANADNWDTLETSYRRFALRLNTHLEDHHFIFGGRPSAADFAIAAQFQQMLSDPTPGEWLRDRVPFVIAWCETMQSPKEAGPTAALSDVKETLLPLFEKEVARTYLPWAAANAASASRQRNKFSVTLEDGLFEQATQRYAARAFRSMKSAFSSLRDHEELVEFLVESGSDKFLL